MAASGPISSDSTKTKGNGVKEWMLFALYPFAKTAIIPFTQPIAKVATIQQKSTTSESGFLNFIKAAKKIYKASGLSGFFHGTTPTMTRELFKSSYKAPLQIYAYDIATNMVSEDVMASDLLKGCVAGGIFGTADSLIAGPIDRYKTKVMTQDHKTSLWQYLQAIFSHAQTKQHASWVALNELYRGLGVTAAKQSVVNSVFFVTHDLANQAVKPYQEEHKKTALIFSTLVPGVAAAFVGAPLDVLKTLSQQHIGVNQGILALLNQVIKQSGFKGLMAGIPARCMLIASGYSLNAFVLNLIKENRQASQVKPEASIEISLNTLIDKLSQLSIVEIEEHPPARNFLPSQLTWLDAECPFSAEVVQDTHIRRTQARKNNL